MFHSNTLSLRNYSTVSLEVRPGQRADMADLDVNPFLFRECFVLVHQDSLGHLDRVVKSWLKVKAGNATFRRWERRLRTRFGVVLCFQRRKSMKTGGAEVMKWRY